MDPAICPPHGEQKQVCFRYNSELGKEETREATISCNPGICSGCIVPKWFGDNWGSKCIEYGFRFEHTIGFGDGVMTDEDRDTLTIAQANSDGEINLTINSDNTATLFVQEWGNVVYSFSEGDNVQIDVSQWADENYLSAEMYVNEVYYDSIDYGNSYINVTFTATRLGQTTNKLNAYCDIDGQVKQQKTEAWGQCQNNFECESNLCSYGECVDLKGIADQVTGFKGFVVKVLCRLGNPLSEDGYLQCVAENA
jgi:hypothetical protein